MISEAEQAIQEIRAGLDRLRAEERDALAAQWAALAEAGQALMGLLTQRSLNSDDAQDEYKSLQAALANPPEAARQIMAREAAIAERLEAFRKEYWPYLDEDRVADDEEALTDLLEGILPRLSDFTNEVLAGTSGSGRVMLERLEKAEQDDRLKTHEINILVMENRVQAGKLAARDAALPEGAAQAALERARHVIDRYAIHFFSCTSRAFISDQDRVCNCGLDAALNALPARASATPAPAQFKFSFTIECPNCEALFEVSHLAHEVIFNRVVLGICPHCTATITADLRSDSVHPEAPAPDPLMHLRASTEAALERRIRNRAREICNFAPGYTILDDLRELFIELDALLAERGKEGGP